MSNPIGYVDTTWSPIAMRCTPVGPACDHCWHLSMANRLAGNRQISRDQRAAYAGDGPPVLTERLEDPLHWKKPRRIAVQFMGDLFHESVSYPYFFYRNLFRVMADCPQHTFLLLTKRPERMGKDISSLKYMSDRPWPDHLPNVHLGVSVWDQESADRNIPILLQIPAEKRWVSYEPSLSRIDFTPSVGLDWIVVGQETGPGARPAKAEWFLKVIEDCKTAGVPVWVKKAPDDVPVIRELP